MDLEKKVISGWEREQTVIRTREGVLQLAMSARPQRLPLPWCTGAEMP